MSGQPRGDAGPLVYLIAGEASGDNIGGRLMETLKRRGGGAIRFAGVGGERMAEQGLVSMFPMGELTLMGFTQVLPRIPNLLRRMSQTARAIRELEATLVLIIDASGFARGVARRLKGSGIPVVQYKAPMAWAYWPWRARKVARYFDLTLAILPFEPAFFAAYGAPCTFIGHPSLELGIEKGDGPAFRARHGIPADAPLLCVLPGSRWSEVSWSLDDFRATVARLMSEIPGLHLVVPTIQPVASRVRAAVADWPLPALVVEGDGERFDAFAASDVALAVSGTVSVDLAIAGVPMAVCYRRSAFDAAVARRIQTVDYVSIVNLVLDRPVIPEFIQDDCRPDKLAEACVRLFTDQAARATQIEGCREAVAELSSGDTLPGDRAAQIVLEMIAGR